MSDLAAEYCPDINREIIINPHSDGNKGNIAMDAAVFFLSQPGTDCDGKQRYVEAENQTSSAPPSSSWADEEVVGEARDVLVKRPEYPCLPQQTAFYEKLLGRDAEIPEKTELSIMTLNMYAPAPAFLTWVLTVSSRDVEAMKKLFDPVVITKRGLIQRDGYEDAHFESPMYISSPKLLDTTVVFSQTSDDMTRITAMFSKFTIDSREVICRCVKRFAVDAVYSQIEQQHREKTGGDFFIRKESKRSKTLKKPKKAPVFKEMPVEKKVEEAPKGYRGGFAALMEQS